MINAKFLLSNQNRHKHSKLLCQDDAIGTSVARQSYNWNPHAPTTLADAVPGEISTFPPSTNVIHWSLMHRARWTKLKSVWWSSAVFRSLYFHSCYCFSWTRLIFHLSGVNFHALRSFCACSNFSFSESKSVFIRWNNKLTAGSSNVERSCIEDGFWACFKSWICVCGRQRIFVCFSTRQKQQHQIFPYNLLKHFP